MRGCFAFNPIGGADGDALHIAEHIELGQRNLGRGLHLYAVARGDQVNRPDTTGPAGLGAVLKACFPQAVSLVAEHLADKGTLAHAGGVRLDDADDPVDLRAGQAGADGRVCGGGVGGGGVGVDAVVEVAQAAQLCLKEDALVGFLRLTQERAGIADKGLDGLAVGGEPGVDFLHGDGLCAVHAGYGQVLPIEQIGKMLAQRVGIEQLAGQHGLFGVLVGIERRDALLGGAEFLVGQTLFLQLVLQAMPGEQQGGAVADHEIVRRERDALAHHILHFDAEVFGVKRHAVAQHIDHIRPEDAGWEQMQGELPVLVDDRMPRVAAALIAHDDVVFLRQQIDHAALAFIAPVDAYNCAVIHAIASNQIALMVEMLGTMSSRTSSRMRTVSSDVKIVTPFCTAHWRISMPSA